MQMAEKIASLQSHNNAAAYLLLLSHDQHLRSASSVGGYCSLPIRLLFLEKLNTQLGLHIFTAAPRITPTSAYIGKLP